MHHQYGKSPQRAQVGAGCSSSMQLLVFSHEIDKKYRFEQVGIIKFAAVLTLHHTLCYTSSAHTTLHHCVSRHRCCHTHHTKPLHTQVLQLGNFKVRMLVLDRQADICTYTHLYAHTCIYSTHNTQHTDMYNTHTCTHIHTCVFVTQQAYNLRHLERLRAFLGKNMYRRCGR